MWKFIDSPFPFQLKFDHPKKSKEEWVPSKVANPLLDSQIRFISLSMVVLEYNFSTQLNPGPHPRVNPYPETGKTFRESN